MDLTFQKQFDDRYTQSREHQILDYLNQRGAAVPRVILSHAERGYLEMSHDGSNLAQWLGAQSRVESPVFDALAQSIRVVLEVSKLGIWHLDVAPRNFLVGPADDESVRVSLIDFGNAVSSLFPLQKPLWMRPSAEQHRLLRQALQQDWQAFYRRHGLAEPADWERSFDVPQDTYRSDWTGQLQVEVIAARPCVLAHGLGQMLCSTARILDWTSSPRSDLGRALLNLESDDQALLGIGVALRQLQAWVQAWRPTPRPKHRSDPSAPAHLMTVAADDPALRATASLKLQPSDPIDDRVPRTRNSPPMSSAGSEPIESWPFQASADGVAERPAAPAARPPETAIETSPRRTRRRRWLPIVSSAVVMTVGWVMLDLIHQTASSQAALALKTPVLALGGVGLAVLGSLIGLGGLLWSTRKLSWWRGLLWVHAVGQGLWVLEFWLLQLPYPVLWFAMACPLLMLLLAAVVLAEPRPSDTA